MVVLHCSIDTFSKLKQLSTFSPPLQRKGQWTDAAYRPRRREELGNNDLETGNPIPWVEVKESESLGRCRSGVLTLSHTGAYCMA